MGCYRQAAVWVSVGLVFSFVVDTFLHLYTGDLEYVHSTFAPMYYVTIFGPAHGAGLHDNMVMNKDCPRDWLYYTTVLVLYPLTIIFHVNPLYMGMPWKQLGIALTLEVVAGYASHVYWKHRSYSTTTTTTTNKTKKVT